MKRVVLVILAVLVLAPTLLAEGKKKGGKEKNYVDSTKIHWLTWNEVQEKMIEEPKKVWVDVYTEWCGWCKRMDATTFQNKEVIKYMNEHFYAVKFNPEKEDSIRFNGSMYYISPESGTNKLAEELMRGQMSYPTFIFMEENFQNHFPIPGYQPVDKIEGILKFLGENTYKSIKWEEFMQDFTPTWVAN